MSLIEANEFMAAALEEALEHIDQATPEFLVRLQQQITNDAMTPVEVAARERSFNADLRWLRFYQMLAFTGAPYNRESVEADVNLRLERITKTMELDYVVR